MKRHLVFIISLLITYSIFAENLQLLEDGNIRENPTIDSKIIQIGKKGDVFDGELVNQDWYKITINTNQKGYIHKTILTVVDNSKSTNSGSSPIIVLSIIFAVAVYILIYGIKRRCPYCEKLFAGIKQDSELLDSKLKYEKENDEQKLFRIDVNRVYYKCKHCDQEWTKVENTKRSV